MKVTKLTFKAAPAAFTLAVVALAMMAAQAAAQTASPQSDGKEAQAQQQAAGSADQYFKEIYRNFYSTYKVGPADELAIRIVGQPDYTLEKAPVSPVGRLYHPLIGDVDVVGLTIDQLTERLTIEFSQFVREPKVSVSLVSANSSMIGVVGDITRPGILVMSRPMTMLDAITASGGVTDLGSQSNITLVRRAGDGTMRTMKVNLKRVLEGKADAEENVVLQAGDTLVVHGNARKKIATITSLLGFGRFVEFLARR